MTREGKSLHWWMLNSFISHTLEKGLKHTSAPHKKGLNHQFRKVVLVLSGGQSVCHREVSATERWVINCDLISDLIVPLRGEWLLMENDFASKMNLALSFEISCRLLLLQYPCTTLGSLSGSQIHWQMQSLSPSLHLFRSFNLQVF